MEILNVNKRPQADAVDQLALERALGCGSCSAGLCAAYHPASPNLLAYPSGGVVVLWDSARKQQLSFFRSKRACRPFASLAFSRDGAYLAAGERSTTQGAGPEIIIWECSTGRQLQALRGHKHGVGSVAFSHDGRLLVTTGESYDGQLCVWDWQAGVLLCKQHAQTEVYRACFVDEAAASTTIATIGKSGHFKVWALSPPTGRGTTATLTPRPINLKEYRTSSFVAVAAVPPEAACPGQPQQPALLYALTQPGVLLTLRPNARALDKSVSLQVPAAFALAVSPGLVACACAAGVVRLFATRTLAFRGNLPRPSARGAQGGAQEAGEAAGPAAAANGARAGRPAAGGPGAASAAALFPDAVACSFDSSGERLAVCYSDRSIIVWDVRNPSKVVRTRSIFSHAGTVWGASLIPSWQAALIGQQQQPGCSGAGNAVAASPGPAAGQSSVLCTCAADGTVRLWNVCMDPSASTSGPTGMPQDPAAVARVTRTLRAVIYTVPPANDGAAAAAANAGSRRFAPDACLPPPGARAAPTSVALRCLRVSPCGRHLATGDSRGNLRIHSLATMQLLLVKEAHDTEILTLDYSTPSLDGVCYLASGSRDALIHVFDMSRGYELVGTCDAHSGPVTAVRFSASGGRMALISCSADKSVVFRHVQLGACGLSFSVYQSERLARGVLFDLAVDPAGGRAVAVGQDGQVRLFDVATGRAIRNFSAAADCGEAVGVVMDASGHLAVVSCSDGGVAVYDLEAGRLVARGSGHGDVCTGALLLEDHRGLVTVGGDGCALMWRLTTPLARRMQEAAAQCQRQLERQAAAQAAAVQATPAGARRRAAWGVPAAAAAGGAGGGGAGQEVEVDISATLLRVRQGHPLLSVDKLPKWAQAAHREDAGAGGGAQMQEKRAEGPSKGAAAQPALQGKWAQRLAAAAHEVQQPAGQVGADGGGVGAVAVAVAAAGEGGSGAAGTAAVLLGRVGVVLPETMPAVASNEDLEEEDGDIVLYDAEEEEEQQQLPQPGKEGQAGPEMGKHDEARFAVQDADAAEAPCGEPEPESHESPQPVPSPEPDMEPESGCASNRMGATPAQQPAREEGDAVKRDLFREHFDSLGLDQGSATKAPTALQPDPRRQSLSLMYRQARGVASAAPAVDSAALAAPSPAPTPGTRPGATGAAAPGAGPATPAAAAAAPDGGTTPYLARVPVPAGITTTRGNTVLAGGQGAGGGGGGSGVADADGAITSAPWTPERAMLPLTSPVLAQTDMQLVELQCMKERLASTLRKKSQPPAEQPPAATAGAVAQEPAAPPPSQQQQQQRAQPQPQAAAPVPATANCVAGAPPVAVDPITAAPVQPAPELIAVRPAAPPEPQPSSPGFSTLTQPHDMLSLGQGPITAHGSDLPGCQTPQAHAGGGAAEATSEGDWAGFSLPPGHLHVNPMYGATPGTPMVAPMAGAEAPGGVGMGPGSRPEVRASLDDVIRQVLSSDAGPEPAGSVCVVAQGASGAGVCGNGVGVGQDGKQHAEQQQQEEVVRPVGTASSSGSPAKRPKPALPAIRAKPPGAAAASGGQLAAVGEARAPAAGAVEPQSEAVVAGALAALQDAVSGVEAALQHLQLAAGASAAPNPAALALAGQLKSGAQEAMQRLAQLLLTVPQRTADGATAAAPAAALTEQEPSGGLGVQHGAATHAAGVVRDHAAGRQALVVAQVSGGVGVTAASDTATSAPSGVGGMAGGVGVGGAASGVTVELGLGAGEVGGAGGEACSVSSSQVLLTDVGGVMESLVQEKVQAQMRMVEEIVMQRIMSKMRMQQQ